MGEWWKVAPESGKDYEWLFRRDAASKCATWKDVLTPPRGTPSGLRFILRVYSTRHSGRESICAPVCADWCEFASVSNKILHFPNAWHGFSFSRSSSYWFWSCFWFWFRFCFWSRSCSYSCLEAVGSWQALL